MVVWPEVVVSYIKAEYHDKYGSDPRIEAKHEEISVIEMSDTVVKPRTVMVHLQNTPVEPIDWNVRQDLLKTLIYRLQTEQ